MAAVGLFKSITTFCAGLESIGKLKDHLVHLGRVIAVQEFVVAFKEQRGCDVVDIAGRVSPGVEIKCVIA
jgi:hypothetical protein